MNDCILRAEAVHFEYEDKTPALNGIELSVGRGEKLAVMGANGSGKSTFFLCLNGVNRPKSGALYLDGEPYRYSSKALLALRSRVGIVFQDPDNQLFSADVYGEIAFGALNLGLPEKEVRRRVETVMDELKLTALADKPVHLLSGGQKKLIAIADVLVMEPDIILLDEPSAALDPHNARLVDHVIDSLSLKGITVILSTHDVDRALTWADSIVLFDKGRVLAKGAPCDILKDEALLIKSNLEKPAVLSLFLALCDKGLLPAGLPVPRSGSQLLEYLTGHMKPRQQKGL